MDSNEQLTEKELKWGMWFLTHKEQLRAVGVWAMVALSVALWGFAIVRFAYFLIVEEPKTKAALQQLPIDLANTRGARSGATALDATLKETKSFSVGEGRYDFLARVWNPNPRHAVEQLRYSFAYDGGQTPEQTATILPGGETVVYALGIPLDSPPNNVRFVANELQWKQIVGWDRIKEEKMNIAVDDVKVEPISGGGVGSIVRFTVTNKTVFNYWYADVVVSLRSGDVTSGVNAVRLEKLKAGESREVALQWFGAPNASVVDVRPQLNVLDPSIIMEFSGETPRVFE